MSQSQNAFWLILPLLATACGGSTEDLADPILISPIEAMRTAANIKLPSNTPEGLAYLVSEQSAGSLRCSGSLIGQNYILTNSHCLEGLVDVDSDACAKTMAFVIKNQVGQTTRGCKKVLSRTELHGKFLSSDLALLELDAPVLDARSFEVSRDGVIEGDRLVIQSFDPDTDGTYDGERPTFREQACTTRTYSILGNFSHERSTSIPLFSDDSNQCRVIQGNSGSPILNSSGKVVALAKAGTRPGLNLGQVLGGIEVNAAEVSRHISLGTNLACSTLNEPILDANRPKNCDSLLADESRYSEKLLAHVMHELTKKTAVLEKTMAEKMSSAFQFDVKWLTINNSLQKGILSPKCIKPLVEWEEADRARITEEGRGRRKVQSYNLEIPLFTLKIAYKLDYFGRLSIGVDLDVFTNSFRIPSLNSLDENGEVELQSKNLDRRFNYSVTKWNQVKKLKLCTPGQPVLITYTSETAPQ